MSNQVDSTSIISAIAGAVAGIVGSIVALRSRNQDAESDLRTDLLQLVQHHSSRISALEQENKTLHAENQELRKERDKLILDITELQKERDSMKNRLSYLEQRLTDMDALERRMAELLQKLGGDSHGK